MLKIIEVFMRSVGTVNVLKVLTLIYFYYFRCSKFYKLRFRKMPVFEILECGLYHEKKKGIYACQNVVETS